MSYGVFRQRFDRVPYTRRPVILTAPTSGVTYTYSPSGGIVLAGTAPLVTIKIPQVSGGVTLAGQPPIVKVKIPQVSGGVVFAGTAPNLLGKVFMPSGGYLLAGTSPLVIVNVVVPSGGAVFGGSAGVSFVGNGGVGSSRRTVIGNKWYRNQ